MKPLKNIHLQESIHLSRINVSAKTLRTSSLRSLKEVGPDANSENSVDVRAAAAMCQFAYFYLNRGKKTYADLIDGWKPMTPFEVEKIVPGVSTKLKNDFIGFSSMLFHKQADGIQYYAYCTEGTDIFSIKDWYSNIHQWFNGDAPQYSYSIFLAKLIDYAIGDKAVLWFIGHSLGGGLASNNALVTGRHAITFNAAGLHSNRIKATFQWDSGGDYIQFIKRTRQIHAFVVDGEILNKFLRLFRQQAYGDTHIIKLKNNNISSFNRHSMMTILDNWGMKHE